MQNDTKAKFYMLIPSAGTGTRAGASVPKQYQMLAGRSVLEHTLAALEQLSPVRVRGGVLVLAPDDQHWKSRWPQALTSHKLGRFHMAPVGGARRADTVAAGLVWLREQGAEDHDWVLVHDAARCLVQPEWIERLIDTCLEQDKPVGALLAVPLSDTLKASTPNAFSNATLSRNDKWLAQTPQCFPLELLEQALHKAVEDGVEITDEASAVERLGVQPQLVLGHSHNIKITYPEDFALASAIMQSRQNTAAPSENSPSDSVPSLNHGFNLRIGEGWDTHQLVDAAATGRKLILGGVEIAHDKALLGHSDADVLLHAITDAVLGAAGLGDIGRHFPDTDDQYQGADSKVLLQTAYARVQAAGYRLQNLDATIIAQAPKLMPYMDAIRASVSQCLGVHTTQVNIKAKTAEKLGPVGEGLSMEARAVVLLVV